jgi:hypothetical protein
MLVSLHPMSWFLLWLLAKLLHPVNWIGINTNLQMFLKMCSEEFISSPPNGQGVKDNVNFFAPRGI